MKSLKLIPLVVILVMCSSISFSQETKKDCSLLSAATDEKATGSSMLQAWKCRKGFEKGEGLTAKLKKIFKKSK